VKLKTRKVAVFVTCLGIAGALPVLSSADQGGDPNIRSKPCKTHKAKKKPMKTAPNTKGKKCGFNRGTTTATPTTATPTPSTSSTETTTTKTSTTTTAS
jgi:hypothetical protein